MEWVLSLLLHFFAFIFSGGIQCSLLCGSWGCCGKRILTSILGTFPNVNLGQSILFTLLHINLNNPHKFVLFSFIEENIEAEILNILISFTPVSSGVRIWNFPYNTPPTAKHRFFLLQLLGRSQTKFLEQPLKECLFSSSTLKFLSDIQVNCAADFVIQSNAAAVLYFCLWITDPRNWQQHEFLSVKEL